MNILQKIKEKISTRIGITVSLLVVLCGAVVGAQYISAAGYTAPPCNVPSNCNTDAPLNVSIDGQSKAGGLLLATSPTSNGLIVANGNVGIGTTNPLTKLNIEQTGGNMGITFSDGYQGVGNYRNQILNTFSAGNIPGNYMKFNISDGTPTGLNTRMFIRGDGNVGIGTITPSGKLSIDTGGGDTLNVYKDPSTRALSLQTALDGLAYNDATNTGAPNYIATNHISLEPLAGNVGIGITTAPKTKLQVNGNVGADKYCDQDGGNCITPGPGTAATIPTLEQVTTPDNSTDHGINIKAGSLIDRGFAHVYPAGAAGTNYFYVEGDGYNNNGNNAIRIGGFNGARTPVLLDGSTLALNTETQGNVGIGVTSPITKLQVNGSVGADKYCDQNGGNCITPGPGTAVTAPTLEAVTTAGNTTDKDINITSQKLFIGNNGGNYFYGNTQDLAAMIPGTGGFYVQRGVAGAFANAYARTPTSADSGNALITKDYFTQNSGPGLSGGSAYSLAKWTSATTIGTSGFYDDGSSLYMRNALSSGIFIMYANGDITAGTSPSSAMEFNINGDLQMRGGYAMRANGATLQLNPLNTFSSGVSVAQGNLSIPSGALTVSGDATAGRVIISAGANSDNGQRSGDALVVGGKNGHSVDIYNDDTGGGGPPTLNITGYGTGASLAVNNNIIAHQNITADGTLTAAALCIGSGVSCANGSFTPSGNDRFTVNGNIQATNHVSAQGAFCLQTICESTWGAVVTAGNQQNGNNNSDVRLKKNIATLNDSLSNIMKLRPVTYEWKNPSKGTGEQIGVIAQEVEKVFPDLVQTDSTTGIKSVEYDRLVAPLIGAVQEQQAEIQTLTDENKVLTQRVDNLEKSSNK